MILFLIGRRISIGRWRWQIHGPTDPSSNIDILTFPFLNPCMILEEDITIKFTYNKI